MPPPQEPDLLLDHPDSSAFDCKLNPSTKITTSPGLRKKMFKETRWKWTMLVLVSVLMMGNYFCYDNPGVIEDTCEKDMDVSQAQYSLLYSVYAYPNIILPIVGGILIDILGIR